MTDPVVAELLELLALERIEDNLFRGISRDIGTHYVFGGQVLGQALSAAQMNVDPVRVVHSLHAYFLRAGDVDHPIVYHVENPRDGKSFSVRRVVAIQHGKTIFNMSASFQEPEPGAEHQLSAPDVPRPEDLPEPAPLPAETMERLTDELHLMARWLGLESIELGGRARSTSATLSLAAMKVTATPPTHISHTSSSRAMVIRWRSPPDSR